MSASLKSSGVYIPPFKLARLKEEITDPHSSDGQRIEWERMRKAIKGLVNKVSSSNIKDIVQDLFVEDLMGGRGLFVRSIMHAQLACPVFSGMFAALVAAVNTKIPEIGDLLIRRLILQFRRAYTRSDEIILTCVCKFVAHLFNQRVVSEMVVLQIVTIFLEKLSSDSVKVCCQMLFECGDMLSQVSSKGMYFIFERLRQILQEGLIDKRVQYTIETLFEARRKKFVGYPPVLPELDLVEEDDQITHEVDVIEGEIDGEESLNLFHAMDAETYVTESETWRSFSNEILGIAEDGEEDVEDSVDEEEEVMEVKQEQKATQRIADLTEQDLINLRKTIYLAIMSSANFEECVHKILSLKLRNGQEREVVIMLIDSSAMEKASNKFFHFQAERLCRLSRVYRQFFEEAFALQYAAMHRHETNKIRNIAKLYSYLLVSDAISWNVLQAVRLTEEETTSSTRIFVKILFQDLAENMGANGLLERVRDERFAETLSSVFPTDSIEKMRFSVNFFTAIGLGPLTVDLRQKLADATQQLTADIKRSHSESPHVRAERRSQSPRPERSHERRQDDHPKRSDGRSQDDHPERSYERRQDDHPKPSFDRRSRSPSGRPERSYERRSRSASRHRGDRERRSYPEDHSQRYRPDRGNRSYRQDRSYREDRSSGDHDRSHRDERSYRDDRSQRDSRSQHYRSERRRRSRSTDSFGRRRRDVKSEDRSP